MIRRSKINIDFILSISLPTFYRLFCFFVFLNLFFSRNVSYEREVRARGRNVFDVSYLTRYSFDSQHDNWVVYNAVSQRLKRELNIRPYKYMLAVDQMYTDTQAKKNRETKSRGFGSMR